MGYRPATEVTLETGYMGDTPTTVASNREVAMPWRETGLASDALDVHR